jgi:hypothetical protein
MHDGGRYGSTPEESEKLLAQIPDRLSRSASITADSVQLLHALLVAIL